MADKTLDQALLERGYTHFRGVGRLSDNMGKRVIFDISAGGAIAQMDVVQAWAWLEADL